MARHRQEITEWEYIRSWFAYQHRAFQNWLYKNGLN